MHSPQDRDTVQLMYPVDEFRRQPQEFWALVKLISQILRYSQRGTATLKRYHADDIVAALEARGLTPAGHKVEIDRVVAYANLRADLLENVVEPNLMSRDEAAEVFSEILARTTAPTSLVPMNKQRGDKRHPAYLTGIVNMLTYETLLTCQGHAMFDANPRVPLTFARSGMPLRTLSRWMDGAYPDANHPHATWEIKEYYGTKTFGSRVADGVYETALDGHELNDLRSEGVTVEHYLFLDDYFTWWQCGRSYLCRIVDMLHSGLLDGAFFGREVITEWPSGVASWPGRSPRE
jgi:hypothetical protein